MIRRLFLRSLAAILAAPVAVLARTGKAPQAGLFREHSVIWRDPKRFWWVRGRFRLVNGEVYGSCHRFCSVDPPTPAPGIEYTGPPTGSSWEGTRALVSPVDYLRYQSLPRNLPPVPIQPDYAAARRVMARWFPLPESEEAS